MKAITSEENQGFNCQRSMILFLMERIFWKNQDYEKADILDVAFGHRATYLGSG